MVAAVVVAEDQASPFVVVSASIGVRLGAGIDEIRMTLCHCGRANMVCMGLGSNMTPCPMGKCICRLACKLLLV